MFFEAATELIGFIASFFATGAAAFRYVVLRDDAAAEPEVERRAARRTALLGIIGATISALMYVLHSLPGAAARQHKTILKAAIATGPTTRSIASPAVSGSGRSSSSWWPASTRCSGADSIQHVAARSPRTWSIASLRSR